ncbi:hypothetical protein TWF192_001793 [Orbilia oligospora]|uniref:Uncharacterized protein n=1 Tax=Orbilia oligospora TaxID=2813651 RepID=A0A6G1MGT9_ORBOL|nr:hypothetical protein TWF191_000669 [Orbilia oligospora]KAF3256366.1 hypothetical protein TWF192_001793 [Orbilia oligospora]
MVRGYPNCYRFCQQCKSDCICGNCDWCHTCRPHKDLLDSLPETRTHRDNDHNIACDNYDRSHSCDLGETQPQSDNVNLKSKDHAITLQGAMNSDFFSIIVGPEKKEFNIHTKALCAASIYFNNIVNSGMAESHDKTVTLDEGIDAETFALFAQYCYMQDYSYEDKDHPEPLYLHAKVYILAERLQCMGLKTTALHKASYRCFTSTPSANSEKMTETILIIYNHTHDVNTGRFPASPKEKWPDCDGVVRDGFRILLAKYWATHLVELRKQEAVALTYQECPEFMADLILFVNPGNPPLMI